MGTVRRQFLLGSLKLFDVVLMVCCFLQALFVGMRHDGGMAFGQFLEMKVGLLNVARFSILLLLWHATFAACGMYGSRRLLTRRADVLDIIRAVTCGTGLIFICVASFHLRTVNYIVLLAFWSMAISMTMMSRLLLRSLLERVRLRGRNLRLMLIVGTNPRALKFAQGLNGKPELGYQVIGFVDDKWQGLDEFQNSGYSLVCNLTGLAGFLRTRVVDEVVIALPLGSLHTLAAKIAVLCEEQGIITRLLPNIFDLKLARERADELEGASLITHYTGTAEGWQVLAKRLVDILGAFVVLLGTAPLMLLAALLVKLTSPGPVFFRQRRLGIGKREFDIYKFRTMIRDAENKIAQLEHLNEVSGPVFKIRKDPRITSVGRLLRRTSIDELPQLFNVLKGEMSLVGPRPLPIRDYQGFSEDWQRRRFSVRPGITCLWQINGRSSVPFERWMQLDLQYIDKWSLWLDFQILLLTIPAVLKGSGAA